VTSATSASSSSEGLTNTPTTSARRLSASPISAAAVNETARGDPGQMIIPTAQAPAETASSASERRVIPQNLIRVNDAVT
jgi:hypothetical protein